MSSTDGIHHVAASDGSSASFGIGGDVWLVCGVRSPAALEAELSRAIDSGAISTTFGWVRCPSEDGTASNLWRRDALVLAETLTVFVQMFAGCVTAIDLWRYRNSFHWVPRRLLRSRRICYLHCRDPWEAKVFADIELNVEVMLGTSARAIVGKSRIYIDLLLSSPDGRRQVAIECQGKASHGRAGGWLA